LKGNLVVSAVALLLAAALTGFTRRAALAHGVLDVPNERSSHAVPTPRGGGVSIVIASIGAFCSLHAFGAIDFDLFAALAGGGLAVAIVGLMDDRSPLPAGVRLLVHLAAAVWAVAWLLGFPEPEARGLYLCVAVGARVGAVAAIAWALNLYNFMDGIDGIAAVEAIFMSWAGALLLLLAGTSGDVAAAALALGASCFGFLLWNWPPARIFMGDVGSGYLGYALGVLMLACARRNWSALWMWLMLGGAFFVDATVTLVRRAVRGERVYQAHRSHAYQWLSRRWRSHRRVTLTVLGLNLFWLLPCAWFALANPKLAGWTAVVALVPLVGAVLVAGAGRPERP